MRAQSAECEYAVVVTHLEIYNEELSDLLGSSSSSGKGAPGDRPSTAAARVRTASSASDGLAVRRRGQVVVVVGCLGALPLGRGCSVHPHTQRAASRTSLAQAPDVTPLVDANGARRLRIVNDPMRGIVVQASGSVGALRALLRI